MDDQEKLCPECGKLERDCLCSASAGGQFCPPEDFARWYEELYLDTIGGE